MNQYLLYKNYITWSFQIMLILNLDYSKNVLSSCINYCSMNEDVQYKQGRSSVLAQGVLLKIVSNEWVITLSNISSENGQ